MAICKNTHPGVRRYRLQLLRSSQALIDGARTGSWRNRACMDEVQVIKTGCFGLCALGPVVVVYPEGCFYSHVTETDVPEIVEEHILKGRIVTRLLYQETVADRQGHQDPKPTPNSTRSSTAWPCATAASSTPKTSTSTLPWTAMQALGKVLTEMTPDAGHRRPSRTPACAGRGGARLPYRA